MTGRIRSARAAASLALRSDPAVQPPSFAPLRFGGAIDKYVGDAILIFFGDPDKISQRQAGRLIGMTAIMRDVIKFSEEMVALKQKLA
jgi:hypothetical protein